MKSFVITLQNHKYSQKVADRCIASALAVGLTVEKFSAVDKEYAHEVMRSHNLTWTWANNNTSHSVCPKTNLKQHPYQTRDFRTKIACSMSHFLLWKKCVELNEPILILEHDTVFLRPLPDVEFKGICQINDPASATRRGSVWSQSMIKRGGSGVFEKTWVTTEADRAIPDGLAGNSAYMIKPYAAQELIDKYYELGVWPNDATMCKQLFPYLEEYYPFITKVIQTESTTV